MAERRIKRELDDLRVLMNEDDSIRNLIVNENNLFECKVTVFPIEEPQNNSSYDIQISFPTDYPFKPPILKIFPLISHYLVDQTGIVSIIDRRCWSPSLTILKLLTTLLDLWNKKRLKQDLHELRTEALVNNRISNIRVNEDNLSEWKLTIFPLDESPNNSSYDIQIEFPTEYPFKPPFLKFLSPIRNYSVDISGKVSLPTIDRHSWESKNKIVDVLKLLFDTFKTTTEKRLEADLQILRNEALVNNTIRNIHVDENNLYEWRFSIFPPDVPFNVASFGIIIKFPENYPIYPPNIKMLNKIYHPNVTSDGRFCSHCLGIENPFDSYQKKMLERSWRYSDDGRRWSEDTKLIDKIKLVVEIVNKPLKGEGNVYNFDIYNEYMNNPEMFKEKAMEHAIVHGDTR